MLGEMQEKDHIRPLATHYATLIYSYGCLQRDVQSAERVFSEMAKRGIGKDEVVYQAMLDTLISNDQFNSAEQLYQQMQQDIRKSSCPYIENVFIRGYGRKGLLGKAKALFDAMSDDKISSDPAIVIREPSTYEAMVRACIDNKNMAEAKKVFDLMVEREFPEKVTAVVAELISAA
jgi:pentatricopeptide repeat protein